MIAQAEAVASRIGLFAATSSGLCAATRSVTSTS